MKTSEFENELALIEEASGGGFLMVKLNHCRFLSGNGHAVIVFAFILNMLRMKSKNKKDRIYLQRKQLWFRCPAGYIQRETGMSQERQLNAMKTIISAGLITTERRKGNVQWIKVSTTEIKRIESDTKSQKPIKSVTNKELPSYSATDTDQVGNSIITKKHSEMKNSRSPKSNGYIRVEDTLFGDKSPLKGYSSLKVKHDTTQADIELADRIRKASMGAKKIKVTGSIGLWADNVAMIRKKIDNDVPRLERVYDWYCKYCDHPNYKEPIILNAASIQVSTFSWIEGLRQKTVTTETKQITIETKPGRFKTTHATIETDGPPVSFRKVKTDKGGHTYVRNE